VTSAHAVRRQLGLILESIRNEFCWLKNMKYEVSFICPVCCQEGALKFCRKHATQGCKHEECLHFWSESQLCEVGKVICCTKSATTLSNRVDVNKFAPWFVPARNQVNGPKRFFLLSVVKDINCSSVKLSKIGDLETFCVMPFCFLYHFEEKSNEINRNKMVPVQNGLN